MSEFPSWADHMDNANDKLLQQFIGDLCRKIGFSDSGDEPTEEKKEDKPVEILEQSVSFRVSTLGLRELLCLVELAISMSASAVY